MRYCLKDKHVLVTGAASGIGKELAALCAQEGARVILHDRPVNQPTLEIQAAELQARYGVAPRVVVQDLSAENAAQELYAKVALLTPALDVLINNAGVISYGNFHQDDLARINLIVKVNALATMNLMRVFLPDMVKRKSGRILNISSTGAFQPNVYQAVYGASKAFMQSISEAVREELRGTGVLVCTLNPPYTNTPLIKNESYPSKLWWFYFSRVAEPAAIARHGLHCLKKGKILHVPGIWNRIVHLFLVRLTPRRLLNFTCALINRPVKAPLSLPGPTDQNPRRTLP